MSCLSRSRSYSAPCSSTASESDRREIFANRHWLGVIARRQVKLFSLVQHDQAPPSRLDCVAPPPRSRSARASYWARREARGRSPPSARREVHGTVPHRAETNPLVFAGCRSRQSRPRRRPANRCRRRRSVDARVCSTCTSSPRRRSRPPPAFAFAFAFAPASASGPASPSSTSSRVSTRSRLIHQFAALNHRPPPPRPTPPALSRSSSSSARYSAATRGGEGVRQEPGDGAGDGPPLLRRQRASRACFYPRAKFRVDDAPLLRCPRYGRRRGSAHVRGRTGSSARRTVRHAPRLTLVARRRARVTDGAPRSARRRFPR